MHLEKEIHSAQIDGEDQFPPFWRGMSLSEIREEIKRDPRIAAAGVDINDTVKIIDEIQQTLMQGDSLSTEWSTYLTRKLGIRDITKQEVQRILEERHSW